MAAEPLQLCGFNSFEFEILKMLNSDLEKSGFKA